MGSSLLWILSLLLVWINVVHLLSHYIEHLAPADTEDNDVLACQRDQLLSVEEQQQCTIHCVPPPWPFWMEDGCKKRFARIDHTTRMPAGFYQSHRTWYFRGDLCDAQCMPIHEHVREEGECVCQKVPQHARFA
jgi:hypothetical protein